jgi:hypothetical protein
MLDPDPEFNLNADPDPDPWSQTNADPDPGQTKNVPKGWIFK